MGKSADPEIEQIKELLSQVNQKISSAKVLNGGFDRIEQEVSEIREMQAKLSADFDAHKLNDERIEGKLDRLYDPEAGIYAKVQKTETMIQVLTDKVSALATSDDKFMSRLSGVEDKADVASQKIEAIQKIAGEDNKDLQKSIRLSKGFWWFGGLALTGLLSAVGKFLWDLFVG
jgi:outer membrane murein-binding lipoprotein Lpp